MRKRLGSVLMAVALIGAACGDDDSGEAAPTTAPAAPTETTAGVETPPTTEPTAVQAAGPGSGAAQSGSLVLLADDFQDGDAEGWDIDYGWYVFGAGSEVRMAASRSAWMWWPDGEAWGIGYVLRASIRIEEGGLAVAAAVGPEGRYVVHLHADGTDLLIDRPWGTFETLATAAPVTPGEWHALAIGVQDDMLHVYVDGEALAAVVVDRPLVAGSVGFGALDGSIVAFDNLYVTALRGQLPALAPSGPVDPGPAAVAVPEVEEAPEEGGGEEPEGEGEGPEGEGEGGLPNLTAAAVYFDSPHQTAGEPIDLGISVVNIGTVASGPFEVVWEAAGSTCTGSVGSLLPGQFLSPSCGAPGLPAGLHNWTVYIDHDERVAESDESDNVLSGHVEVSVVPPDGPDLIIASGNPTIEPIGSEYDMWVVVADQNEVGFEGSYTTRFLLDGRLVCSVDRTGDLMQSRCIFSGLDVGAHVIEVIADADFDVAETREDNNNLIWEVHVAAPEGAPDLVLPRSLIHPEVGEPFTVQLWIEDANDSGFQGTYEVWFLVDGQRVCTVVAQGASSPTCDYPALNAGGHSFEFVLDGTGAITETNEVNNRITMTIIVG